MDSFVRKGITALQVHMKRNLVLREHFNLSVALLMSQHAGHVLLGFIRTKFHLQLANDAQQVVHRE